MRRAFPIVLLAAILVMSGCGSSKAKEATTTAPNVLPRAATNDEWARRVVDFLLRPLNRDLVVVQNFDSPQVRIYIATRDAQTLRIVRRRLNDLRACSKQMTVIGPPPAGAPQPYTRVHGHLREACKAYGEVASRLLEATDLLVSGDASRGADKVADAHDPSARAAKELSAAIAIAQKLAPFRRAGLRPSV